MTRSSRGHHAAAKTRRRFLVGAVVTVTGAAVAAPLAVARQSGDESSSAHDHHASGDPTHVDEIYQGRRIQVRTIRDAGQESHGQHGQQGQNGHNGHHATGPGPRIEVRIDGKDLHVMRNADGSWVSVVNHYSTFDTPRDVARAAVDELDGAQLVPLD
ncbi:tyrosinase family oxidase copper chaperone [Streptomyces sp. NPDC058486]|uniref:apotyrosinase chaperone MelC1 n=1 Tax=unclassified Streptomyces TaxID=2593676 RepID=UPI00365B1734